MARSAQKIFLRFQKEIDKCELKADLKKGGNKSEMPREVNLFQSIPKLSGRT